MAPSGGLRVWIDIDNPPQVQYLLPFRPAFREAGAKVLLTARRYGMTAEMIRRRGDDAQMVGGEFGRSKARKMAGTVWRAQGLVATCMAWGRPAAVISSSRSAILAGWSMGIRQFAVIDYEHVDLSVFRQTGCHVMHPDVIPSEFFLERGFKRSRLMPFRGLKEDISFSGIGPGALLQERGEQPLTRFLVRPPAEESHYYVAGSRGVMRQAIGFLSRLPDAQVVFVPRRASQRDYLEGLDWKVEPILLDAPVPFPGLLSHADAVISSGGTMLREAAYVGIPAFSTFQGIPGAVDRDLESQGRLVFVRSSDDFSRLVPPLVRQPAMESNSGLLAELVRRITDRIAGKSDQDGY